MPYIPEEIVDKIISFATADSDRRIFTTHASVSHTFHQIALPYRFRSLYIDATSSCTGTAIPKFCEAISAGDTHALSLAPLVQQLTLFMWSASGPAGTDVLFEKTINGVLSFRNLTKLNMRRCITSLAIMEQLGKLVQLQSLHTWCCFEMENEFMKGSYGSLSNLQSLHTLECLDDGHHFSCHLANIPMKNLRILNCNDLKVIEAVLTTDPSVQLEELWLPRHYKNYEYQYRYSLLWNYLARVTSLTHLSLPNLTLQEAPPTSLVFPFQELQYLHIHVAFAPRFANQPLKILKIDTESKPGKAMVEVRKYWKGVVFPQVEYLMTDRSYEEMGEIPIGFWREFLLNVNKVGAEYPC